MRFRMRIWVLTAFLAVTLAASAYAQQQSDAADTDAQPAPPQPEAPKEYTPPEGASTWPVSQFSWPMTFEEYQRMKEEQYRRFPRTDSWIARPPPEPYSSGFGYAVQLPVALGGVTIDLVGWMRVALLFVANILLWYVYKTARWR